MLIKISTKRHMVAIRIMSPVSVRAQRFAVLENLPPGEGREG